LFIKPTIQSLSDKQLLEKYRREDDNVYLGELFGRYIRFVFLVSMKYLRNEEQAKDLSMQVFEKLTDDLKRFDVENFKGWLHVVTRNTCLMYLRAKPSEKVFSINSENGMSAFMENISETHPMDTDQREVRLEQLEKALDVLDDEQKNCVSLFYLQEKSYKEVADITGFSMNQVKSHIQNGKRNLKNYLISQGDLLVWVLVCIYFK
jgi:RNA polymerase sigma factor (sigma-70 family)